MRISKTKGQLIFSILLFGLLSGCGDVEVATYPEYQPGWYDDYGFGPTIWFSNGPSAEWWGGGYDAWDWDHHGGDWNHSGWDGHGGGWGGHGGGWGGGHGGGHGR